MAYNFTTKSGGICFFLLSPLVSLWGITTGGPVLPRPYPAEWHKVCAFTLTRVLGERDRLAASDAHTLRERGPARVAGQSYLAGLEGWHAGPSQGCERWVVTPLSTSPPSLPLMDADLSYVRPCHRAIVYITGRLTTRGLLCGQGAGELQPLSDEC